MQAEIRLVQEKKLVGKGLLMSLTDDKTEQLWRSFMPGLKNISSLSGPDLYSLQVYPEDYFIKDFDPEATFQKWALAEVDSFENIPKDMETFILPGGLYAVFIHKGGPAKAMETFEYIFNEWLPVSGYEMDARPHFEVLGDKYRGDHPDSEEEIFIPIRNKS